MTPTNTCSLFYRLVLDSRLLTNDKLWLNTLIPPLKQTHLCSWPVHVRKSLVLARGSRPCRAGHSELSATRDRLCDCTIPYKLHSCINVLKLKDSSSASSDTCSQNHNKLFWSDLSDVKSLVITCHRKLETSGNSTAKKSCIFKKLQLHDSVCGESLSELSVLKLRGELKC